MDARTNMLSAELIEYLSDLKEHNERTWFEANRDRYETAMKRPAEAFAAALAAELDEATDTAHQIKIFRIHRDVRFAKDKRPYNAYLHIAFFPQGDGACRPAWMFGIEPGALSLGLGSMEFSKETLGRWRERVAGPEGAVLAALLAGHRRQDVRLSDPALKKVPAPYPQDHPQAELLRRKALSLWIDHKDPSPAFGEAGPKRMAADLLRLADVADWLKAL